MKAGQLGLLVVGLLVAGCLVLYLRAPAPETQAKPLAPSSSTTAALAEDTTPAVPLELARGEPLPVRTTVQDPAPKPPVLQTPISPSDDAAAQGSQEDTALLRDGIQPIPTPNSSEEARRQYADLEARYGAMSASDLRLTFDALERSLTQGGEDKNSQLTQSQVDAIRRELTWLKERLYP